MPNTLPNPLWANVGMQFLRRLESSADLTVFGDGPTTLASLPDALGGDPAQHEALAARSSSRLGFLEVLRAKAHFFMLPERIIDDIREADIRLVFSDTFIGATANTRYVLGSVVAIQMASGMPRYLAELGSHIGHNATFPNLSPLGTIYHELCLDDRGHG